MKLKFITGLIVLFISVLSLELKAQCNTPTGLRVLAYGPDFITVDWNSTTASSFQFRYITQGGNISLATINHSTSKPLTISGLSPSTSYALQVRELCTGANPWPSFILASTSCSVVTPPFTAGFNGNAWSNGGFNSAGTINSCWQRDAITGYIWKTGPQTFTSNFTGASTDRSGTGKYVQIDQISFPTNPSDSSDFISPLFDLSALTTPQLTFWYHMFGSDIETLKVYITNDYGVSYNLLQTITGPQQFSNTDAWKESILSLSAYANDTVRLLFKSVEQTTGFQNAICIDDVSIAEAPSCPRPSNLQLQFASTNDVQLSWTTGGANNWQLSYGSPGFAANGGTIVTTNTNPHTLTGLTANTNYEVYVRDSCGIGDLSIWFGPIAFKTACNPISTPYSENFDASGFNTAGTFNGIGTINSCWSRDATNQFIWKTGPPLFSPTNTGPIGDHTTGSAQYLYSEVVSFAGGLNTTVIEGPLIDLNGLTNPELRFYTHMYGSSITSLEVYANDGSGFQLLTTQTGQQQTSKTASWKEVIASLSSFVNDTIKLRFVSNRVNSGNATDIAIDDLTIDEAPNCPKPQNIVLNSISATTANLGWLGGGAANWNISYGSIGTAAGAGTIVNANTNPFILNGLSPNTIYEIFIRDSCGLADVSLWTGPFRIRTSCLPIAAPYFENFDGTDFSVGNFSTAGTLNSCWKPDTGINYQWSIEDGPTTSFNAGPSGDHTSGSGQYLFSQALFNFSLGQVTTTEVLTPTVDLSPLTTPELRFWYHMFGNGMDSLAVKIDVGSGFTHLWSISGQQQTATTDAWQEAIVSLSAYANDTITIRLIAYRNSPFSNQAPISIDDLRIDEQPTCPQPSGFTVSAIGPTSINFNWTTGGAANWQIEYGAPGFTLGTGTLVNVNSNPFTLNGLSPSTPYHFYLRDSCGLNSVSFWTPATSARTACSISVAPYTEDFENGLWTDPLGFNDPGDIDPCWNRSDTVGFLWLGNQGASDAFGGGPSGDHTTGLGFYAYSFRQSGFTTILSTDLETPLVSLDTLSNPELRFWYHMFGNRIDDLVVQVNNGSGWSNLTTISGQQQSSSTAAWQERITSLAAYVGDTIQIRFRSSRTTTLGFAVNIAIDDLRIDNAPTCPEPSNLTSTFRSTTSIRVNWTSGGSTNWDIQYRPFGSTGAFTTVSTATRPYTITGLNPSTTYEIFIRDSCAPGDVSLWNGPLFEGTLCGVTNMPYAENFDGPDWVPGIGFFNFNDQINPCWTRNRAANNDKWGTGTGTTQSFATGPNEDVSGPGNYIYFESDFSSISNPATITSPEIAIVNVSKPMLYYKYHMYGNSINTLRVRVNTRNNGNNVNLKTYTGQQQNSNGAAWKLDSIDLTAYIGDTIEVVFRALGTGGNADIAIDEFEVRSSGPSCGSPFNLQLTSATYNSLDFSWQNSNVGPGASTTTLSWYEAAAGPGTATVIPNVSSPYSISNLNPSTAYVIELFDSCTAAVSSSLIDTLSTLVCDTVTAGFTFTSRFLRRSFTSTSINQDSLIWLFGTGDSAFVLNPNYNFPAAGTYTITLIAANSCGNSDTIVQTIEVCDTLRANFSWTQTDSTRFTADPGNNAVGYSWALGDGTTASGAQASVFYTDTIPKFVTLSAWNNCGDTVRNTRVVEACDPPIADWVYSILSPINSGLRVQFDASLTVGATTYSWDFGDGNSGSGINPIHIYSTPGLFYNVTLSVTGPCGESNRSFRLNEIGIEEQDFEPASVFPNPANNQLFVNWPAQNHQLERLSIYSISGQRLLQQAAKPDEEKSTISLDALAPGFYRLALEGEGKVYYHTFIKN